MNIDAKQNDNVSGVTASGGIASKQNGKRFGLDLLRVILSFGIIVYHYQQFSFINGQAVGFVLEKQPFYNLFYVFYNYGGEYRIPAFWCFSGFLFFWKYNAKIADKRVGAPEFFILRISRLYPVHILTMMLVIILQFFYHNARGGYFVFQNNDVKHFILQLFFASNWGLEKGMSFNGPIWSLSVEVLVYVAFFVISRYLGKSPYVSVLVLLACLAIRAAHIISPVIHCMACFYAGGLAAFPFLKIGDSVYRKRANIIAIILAVIIPLVSYVFRLYEVRFFSAMIVMTYSPIIVFLFVQDVKVNARLHKVVEIFGNMIYSTYLIHFPIQIAIALCCTYLGIAVPMYSSLFFIFYIVLVFSLAYLLWYSFEMPVQLYVRRWWKEVGSARYGSRGSHEKASSVTAE